MLPSMQDVVRVVEEEIQSEEGDLTLVLAKLRGHPPIFPSRLVKEWHSLLLFRDSVLRKVEAMSDAMLELGYVGCDGDYFSSDSAPYFGDSVTTEYMRDDVERFSALLLSECTFMTRGGQRSDPSVSFASLDPRTGLTKGAALLRQAKKRERTKRREEEERQKKRASLWKKVEEQKRILSEVEGEFLRMG